MAPSREELQQRIANLEAEIEKVKGKLQRQQEEHAEALLTTRELIETLRLSTAQAQVRGFADTEGKKCRYSRGIFIMHALKHAQNLLSIIEPRTIFHKIPIIATNFPKSGVHSLISIF